MTTKIKPPKGFLFSTASAEVKKVGLIRKDIAIIYSQAPSIFAGSFTTNKIKGAPVKLCIERIKSQKGNAIIVNSGNSNVATGAQGMKDAHEMTALTAKGLGLKESDVYAASTGVIGVPLPMDRIRPKIAQMSGNIGKSTVMDVAQAIMTTDTFAKVVSKKVKIGGKSGTITGIAKGAGMIAPNMATLLCFVMTDLAVDRPALKKSLQGAVEVSFNRITIDGDMSTSDTAIVMANGLAGNANITTKSEDYKIFDKALKAVLYELSSMIASDGEGATKLIEVEVKGAKSADDAKKAALAIANSNLVKTAIYGADVNWGRVICALGYSGAELVEEKVEISFGKVKVASKGMTTGRDEKAISELKKKNVLISVNLNLGTYADKVLSCDFTEEYVKINAEYKT